MTAHPEQDGRQAGAWSARVKIPETLDEVRETLTGLAGLIDAKHWHRAAIVYAFTRNDGPGRPSAENAVNSPHLSSREFAELGLKGLNSDQTVRRYRRTWAAAMELGEAVEATPGITVDLPGLDWDEMFRDNAGGAHVGYATGDSEWFTPEDIVEAARAVLGDIDLDPASTPDANVVVKAKQIFTAEQDGLAQDWHGRVFMNPPYASALVAKFCEKLTVEHSAGRVTAAVVLVNNATETDWFQSLGMFTTSIAFPRGRVKFWHPEKEAHAGALQGQAVLYIGEDAGKFAAEFSRFGLTW